MKRFLLVATALVTLTSAVAQTPLPRDDNNVYGTFANGLDYVVRRTTNPPGKFSAFLHIKAGALHETEPQNGIAHFLEHMAFNGSKHYAPGELIPALNELGMSFGADSNAHTALDETVYKLHLPENSVEMVERALVILSDIACGLLLTEEEIENERAVILEEKTAGKGLQQRIGEAVRARLFAGSRLVVHDVIGTEERIKGFERDQFVDYWNTWYRPDRMTLIVVGDIDPAAIIAAAEQHLGEFEARAPQREYLGGKIAPLETARGMVFSDPEVVQATVQIVGIEPGGKPALTIEDFERDFAEQIAMQLLTRRLNDLVQKGEAAYLGAGASVSSMLGELRQPAVYAAGDADEWREMLDDVLAEARRVLEHGFTEREFEIVRKNAIAAAEHAVETEPTLEASTIVGAIAGAIGRREQTMSAAQRLEVIRNAIERLSVEKLNAAFSRVFDSRAFAYVLVMPETEGVELPAEADIVAVADAAWARETVAVEEDEAATSILTELPEPGAVAAREHDEDLGVTTVRFENGVVMRHRYMDYRKESVILMVSLPGGVLQETATTRGIASVASLANATSRLTSLQLRDLFAGKNVEFGLQVGADAVQVTLGGDPEDLEAGMQGVYATMTDGRIEQTAFDTWKEATLRQIEQAQKDLQAQFSSSITDMVMNNDVRFRPLRASDVEKLSVDGGQQRLRGFIDGAPLEIGVVGDIDVDAATALVARYFGSMPKATRGFDSLDSLRKVELGEGAQRRVVEVATVTPLAMVLVGFRGCDQKQRHDRRALNLVSKILTDRMRIELREERGLVYSIQCDSQGASAVPGTGLVYAAAPTEPAKAEELRDAIFSIMREFAENGPTEEELAVARKQAEVALDQAVDQPGFWVSALGTLEMRGVTLEEYRDLDQAYASFTVEQLRDVARKYFKDERALSLVATPKQ